MAGLGAGCDEGAHDERVGIREETVPRVIEIIHDDLARHRVGVRKAEGPLSRGFLVEDPDAREAQMRSALKHIQQPPRGILEFVTSPMSFLAAVGRDGVVIARDVDAEDDRLKGLNFSERYPVVRRALEEGVEGYELGEFPSADAEESETSWSMLFVHPVRAPGGGEVIGAVVAGIPLWREAQRISRQLRMENAEQAMQGLVLWAYIYKGDRLFFFDTPPDLDDLVPDGAVRRAGLEESPGGFTGELMLMGRPYGFGVVPVPSLGEDVGIVVIRLNGND